MLNIEYRYINVTISQVALYCCSEVTVGAWGDCDFGLVGQVKSQCKGHLQSHVFKSVASCGEETGIHVYFIFCR